MRPSEIRAKREFTESILEPSGLPFAWSTGDEPPDLWLTVSGRRIAVEVTEVMGRVPLNGREMPSRGVLAALKQTADELEAEAHSRGILDGVYTIRLCPLPMLRDHLPMLRLAILDYIATTKGDAAAETVELRTGANGQAWSITKVHTNGQALHPFITLSGMKWEGEALVELGELVAERLDEKRHRLRRIVAPKLLLLVDAYLFGDLQAWTLATKDAADYGFGMVAALGAGLGCRILAGDPAVFLGGA